MPRRNQSCGNALVPAAALLLLSTVPPCEAQRGPHSAGGQADGTTLSDATLVNRIAARSIGPAVMSGRVADIAVVESPDSRGGRLGTVIYIAAATGGVWKSTSGCVTWEPVLDDAGVGSMGDVRCSRGTVSAFV